MQDWPSIWYLNLSLNIRSRFDSQILDRILVIFLDICNVCVFYFLKVDRISITFLVAVSLVSYMEQYVCVYNASQM